MSKKMLVGKAIKFNPSESIINGSIAKKIPMGALTEFQRKISGFQYSEYKNGPKIRNDDTVVAKITPCLENGKTAFVDILDDNEIAFGSSEFIVLRKTEYTDSEFIYYFARSPLFRERAINCMEGTSGRKRVNENTLKNLEFVFPDLPTQKSIAKVLSDLDAKIELNNRINRELEAMAKTLYDYWFVQFDFPCLPSDYRPSGQVNPNSDLAQKIIAFSTYTKVGGLPLPDGKKWFVYVILCEDGSFYKGMTNDLYRRFYEHYTGQGADWTKTHKPKKIIHWEQFNTQDEARRREEELKTGFGRTWLQREYEKFKKFGSNPSPYKHQTLLMPAGKMVYNAELKREIPEGWEVKTLLDIATYINGFACQNYRPTNEDYLPVIKIREMRDGISESTEKVKADIPDKLIVNDGDVLFSWSASLEVVIWSGGKGGLNQHIFKVTSKKYPRSFYYYQLIWYLQHFKMIAELRKTTMGHITQDHLKQSRIVIPPIEIVKALDKKLYSIQEKQILLHKQSQQLSALRDWLLPMLMNGQVVSSISRTSMPSTTEILKESEKPIINLSKPQGQRFKLWLTNQGIAARGNIDKKTLQDIFDAMDDNDK